jgi:hypothetical protein
MHERERAHVHLECFLKINEIKRYIYEQIILNNKDNN